MFAFYFFCRLYLNGYPGFSNNIAINGQGDDTEYANCPWNMEILKAVTGQSVLRSVIADSNNSQIDTSGWASGIYVVRITKNNEIYTQKVNIK
jgi:hypothetical protein